MAGTNRPAGVMSVTAAHTVKSRLRETIWQHLEDQNLARFPRPAHNRIPNFVGAEEAASKIRSLSEFSEAEVVKVNPDSPQAHVRRVVLEEGKTLLMPTPRLCGGFLRLNPKLIQRKDFRGAASISGAFRVAEKISLSALPRIDLIVAGSVAVSLEGGRIGKGGGYSELEYGILRERGLVDDHVRIVTTVHDSQVVRGERFPLEKHDIPVDYILTPTKSCETHTEISKPKGIYWDLITTEMLEKMPILEELRKSQLK